jgi:hypothetical protein
MTNWRTIGLLFWALGFSVLLVACSSSGASPAAQTWPSSPSVKATTTAQHLLETAVISPEDGAPCSTIKVGRIGPFSAPINWCGFPNGKFGVIKFFPDTLGNSGIAYHPGSFATLNLYDDCVRQVGENWWMYQRADPGCPTHYQLISGP